MPAHTRPKGEAHVQPSASFRIFFVPAGLSAVLLAVLVAMAYSNTLHVPLIFDDEASITENRTLRSWRTAFLPPLDNGITVATRPVLNASFALNYLLDGASLRGLHLTNIFIHTLAAIALWAVIRRTLNMPVRDKSAKSQNDLWAWLAAALWALHPLQTESVTYTVQRAESLAGLFFLLTLYGFICSAERPASRLWPVITWLCCLFGMGTKEIMATAPLLVFLFDRAYLSGTFRESWRRHRKLHLALASTWILLGVLVLTNRGRGGSVGFDGAILWWEYALTQVYAVARYLYLTVWPFGLTLDYGVASVKDVGTLLASGLTVAALIGATLCTVARHPQAGFLGCWFFIILAPTSSIIPVATQTIAEHRMYLPLAAITTGWVLLLRRFAPRYAPVLLFALVAAAGLMTWQRNKTYATVESIWKDTVAKRPENPRALINLGNAYNDSGRLPEAIHVLRQAVAIDPDFAEAHCMLAQTLAKTGQNQEALALAEKGLNLAPARAEPNACYGNLLSVLGEPEKAVPYLEKAVALLPERSDLHFNLANSYARLGRDAEAADHYAKVLAATPDDIEARNHYGTMLRRMGRLPEAIAQFEETLRIKPDFVKAHTSLGVALIAQGNLEGGLRQLLHSRDLDPASEEIRFNLCCALAMAGRLDEAITECEHIIRQNPSADFHTLLGTLHLRAGRPGKAASAFRAALWIDPNHPEANEQLARLRNGP